MRRLLSLSVILTIIIALIGCGDSGTGPDPDEDDSGTNSDNEEPTTYTVSVDMTPSDAGAVSPSLEDAYEEGSEIQLLANPEDEYVFTGWTGDMEGNVNPLPLTVSQNFSITANFELKNYELTINIEGEGTIKENVLEQKSQEYEYGTAVELIANPAEGYKFVEWKGDLEGTDNPAQITVDNPKQVTAVFEKKSYELAVTTQGSGAVSERVVSKAKDYEYGDVVELAPSAAEGWRFVEWTGDLTGADNPAQITIDEAKAVTAVFERKTFALAIDIQGEGTIAKNPDQAEYEYGDKVTLSAQPADNWSFKEWAGEISGTTSEISVTVYSERDITAVFEEKPLFYLGKNGYTVVCPDAEPGEKGILNGKKYGKEYEAVDRAMLVQKIENDEDVTVVCTSLITDMSNLFGGGISNPVFFNQDISRWDVSNVTDMNAMFDRVTNFNQDLENWSVSNVTDMSQMFSNADSFNGNISNWDVSNVTDMNRMFSYADSFNSNIGSWNVSSVTNMYQMFLQANSFNGDIGSWDVSNVTNMSWMFAEANNFNSDLINWDVSSVTDMNRMFLQANSFNGDLSNWDVSNVTDMGRMFYFADSFNGDISNWDVSSVTEMYLMFYYAGSFNSDISNWDVGNVTDMRGMFASTDSFDGDIGSWDVSSVTDMSYMFRDNTTFNANITNWDVSSVMDMGQMFKNADSFFWDISSWDVSSVTKMREMFYDNDTFNRDLTEWCVGKIGSPPTGFNGGTSALADGNTPNWGTCQ